MQKRQQDDGSDSVGDDVIYFPAHVVSDYADYDDEYDNGDDHIFDGIGEVDDGISRYVGVCDNSSDIDEVVEALKYADEFDVRQEAMYERMKSIMDNRGGIVVSYSTEMENDQIVQQSSSVESVDVVLDASLDKGESSELDEVNVIAPFELVPPITCRELLGPDYKMVVMRQSQDKDVIRFNSELIVVKAVKEMPLDVNERITWLVLNAGIAFPIYKYSRTSEGYVCMAMFAGLTVTSGNYKLKRYSTRVANRKLWGLIFPRLRYIPYDGVIDYKKMVELVTDKFALGNVVYWTSSVKKRSRHIVTRITTEAGDVGKGLLFYDRDKSEQDAARRLLEVLGVILNYTSAFPNNEETLSSLKGLIKLDSKSECVKWLTYRKSSSSRVQFMFIKGMDIHHHDNMTSIVDECDCSLYLTLRGPLFDDISIFKVDRYVLGVKLDFSEMVKFAFNKVDLNWTMTSYVLCPQKEIRALVNRASEGDELALVSLASQAHHLFFKEIGMVVERDRDWDYRIVKVSTEELVVGGDTIYFFSNNPDYTRLYEFYPINDITVAVGLKIKICYSDNPKWVVAMMRRDDVWYQWTVSLGEFLSLWE